MELKQNLIHRKYHKAEAKNQISIGGDFGLSEGKPDMEKILQTKSEILVEEVHTEKGKVKIRGKLKLWVLYLTVRQEEPVNCLEPEFMFDEVLYMEGASNGDNLRIDWNIDNLQVSMIHPGKIGVRAMVTLYGEIAAEEPQMITEDLSGDGAVHTKAGSVTMAVPVLEKKESYRIRDEVMLPVNKPNVQTVFWKDLQLRGLDLRIQEGRIAIKGEMLCFVVYQPESERENIQCLEQSIPFHGTLDVMGLTPEMYGLIEPELVYQSVELKPDYDGEMRQFQIEMNVELHLYLYKDETYKCLEDAYSTGESFILHKKEVPYQKLRMCTFTKCRIKGQESVGPEESMIRVLGHHAKLHRTSVKIVENGILWEGFLEVQILYANDSGEKPLGSLELRIPAGEQIEIPGMAKEDQWQICEMVEQLQVGVTDRDEVEVQGVIGLNVCVMEQARLEHVNEVTVESYDEEAEQKRPGMKIHFVQPKETLWDIAKKNRTTVEEICIRNDLTGEEVAWGQKLILIKQCGEQLSF